MTIEQYMNDIWTIISKWKLFANRNIEAVGFHKTFLVYPESNYGKNIQFWLNVWGSLNSDLSAQL